MTINNFISPNINIMNSLPVDKNNEKNSKAGKCAKREEKNARAQSEKEAVKANNDSLKNKADKSKNYKRVTENSPKLREKKLEKAVSLQFKKNN